MINDQNRGRGEETKIWKPCWNKRSSPTFSFLLCSVPRQTCQPLTTLQLRCCSGNILVSGEAIVWLLCLLAVACYGLLQYCSRDAILACARVKLGMKDAKKRKYWVMLMLAAITVCRGPSKPETRPAQSKDFRRFIDGREPKPKRGNDY